MSGRVANAAYLAGYAIECTLKVLIAGPGGGSVPFSHDLEQLEVLALSATVKRADRHRCFPSEAVTTGRNHGWDPKWRYAAEGLISDVVAAELVDAARSAADGSLVGLRLDGEVTQ